MTEDINESKGSFGDGLVSSSIYFADPNAAEELSKIITNNTPNEELKQSINELNEKNELKSAYKKNQDISDEKIRKGFDDSKVKATELQFQSNLTKENYTKLKSKDVSPDDDLYLKIEDFPDNPIAELFIYDEAVDKIRCLIPSYEKDLNSMNIKDLKRDNIYSGKGVEAMVEQTYSYDKYLKEQMIEEICYLKRIMNCWRRVAGDGNCFYRSVIFSWLEYLIFNKKISILKIIIANIYLKFDPNYPKIKELPQNIKKQFITEERYLVITVIEIIIRLLQQDQIEQAYLTLIKAFNVTRVFDRIMIFYLRYLLYEYISNNKNKLFKKDFEVLLGNLLPQEYETEDGNFLYDEYFKNDLLKFYTCAEKLAVYLVPFILKVNLNIVFYYFGNDCDIEKKFFNCGLPNKDKIKDTINVLYRKAHYDVCYTKEYYNDFQPLLDKFCNLNSSFGIDYFIVDINNINKKAKLLDESNPYNPDVSIVFNKLLEKKKKEQNVESKNTSTNNNTNSCEENKEADNNIILNGIIKGHSLDRCFICKNEIENEGLKDSLPCKCPIIFCSEKCKDNYNNCLCSFYNSMDFGINIICGSCGSNITRTKFLENLNFGNDNVKNALKKRMLDFYNNYCMSCLKSINSDSSKYKKVKCKCPQLHKLLGTNKFEHKACKECSKNLTGSCKICNLYHSRLVN